MKEAHAFLALIGGHGVVHGEVKRVKEEMVKAATECWHCGTYECVIESPTRGDGSPGMYSAGDKTRICGPWKDCPSVATLSDGSKWQFKGDCKCDG